MTGASDTALPEALAELRDDFHAIPSSERLTLLLELSNELRELPERFAQHPDLLEPVLECQSPISLFIELEADDTVHLHASAPPEAPTTRGFASILQQGIDGVSADALLAIPDDIPFDLGLTELVSPLRLRGMVGMLARAKRQVHLRRAEREATATGSTAAGSSAPGSGAHDSGAPGPTAPGAAS